jgi:ABC-type glycerol-3-phosphate transport system substrate-binding protein
MEKRTLHFLRGVGAVMMLVVMPFTGGYPGKPFFAQTTAGNSTPQRLQPNAGGVIEVTADSFGFPLADDGVADQYPKSSVFLQQNDVIQFTAMVATGGYYTLSFDMAAAEAFYNPPTGQIKIDGAFPFENIRNFTFPVYYQNTMNEFPLDRYGNQALIRQERLIRWSTPSLRDADFSQKYPLQVWLDAGEHEFEFTLTQESMHLGSLYLTPSLPDPGYDAYLDSHSQPDSSGELITLEAEWPSYKNDTSIRPINSRSLEVTPYDTYQLLLNTLGGDSWGASGSSVYYQFNVTQDGMYYITLRALQNTRNNFTVFRRITINDAVLFDQLNELPFTYSTKWRDVTLGGNEPYRIYLKKGLNILGIEANDSPYYSAIQKIKKVLVDINTLSLEIKKLTGNQADPYREWVISDYIPNLQERLVAIADDLKADQETLTSINQGNRSQEVLTYQMAIDNILFLAQDPDKVPVHMNRFSQGSGSAAQLLANLLPLLQDQPLALDKIYIHSPDVAIPEKSVSFITSFTEGAKRFFHSFLPDPYQSITAGEGELSVWVNRPRQYVDVLQMMTDEGFTQETGIRVKFSIMPDESKLVLANAAGIQPDVALGVSTNVPYELAIRNALHDLRSFDDFDSFIREYTPGSLLSYIINDSAYALPETQDFWVTYYRKDIMDSIGLPIPHTWKEVLEILPELQRYGMNFNTPLSSGAGQKGFLMTAPYLFNYGAQLYSPDGFSTGLASDAAIEAMKFMAESFTVYGMPLTTASFYNDFRIGSLPIGVSNVETYIKLLTAAPEITGLWKIDLYPSTVLPDGTQNRWATGSAQACIMFKNTKVPEQAWKFMKWWMSTQTQMDFQQQLLMNYGKEYLWFSANVEAFRYLPILQEHKDVILEQWQWLQEPVKLPGGYMEEREISNAWNSIVFDGVNPRVAIDNTIITINREITRKMEEFGFLVDGVKVKEFKIPTIDTVKGWMNNAK